MCQDIYILYEIVLVTGLFKIVKKILKNGMNALKFRNNSQGLVSEKWKNMNLIRTNQGQINNHRYY